MSVPAYMDYIMLLGASAALIKGHTENTMPQNAASHLLAWVSGTAKVLSLNEWGALLLHVTATGLWSSAHWSRHAVCKDASAVEHLCGSENVVSAGTEMSSTAAWSLAGASLAFEHSSKKQNRVCHFHERTFCIKWAFRVSSIYAVVCQAGIFLHV